MLPSLVRYCVLLLLLPLGNAWAAIAMVDAVQMPAWIEHDSRIEPLVPGQKITTGDKVRTGQGARVYIKLPEGSTVKLGESALLTYRSAVEQDSIFKIAMGVATGAFRFTTETLRRFQKREVAIQLGNATIGIRGTDVWGRSGNDEDLVTLLEGHVEVRSIQGDAVQLTEPWAVFTAPKQGPANPVSMTNEGEAMLRARETEIEMNGGALRHGGKARLLLDSFDDEQQAIALYDSVRAAGYGAKIHPVRNTGSESMAYRYEVAISGFRDKTDALAAARRLKLLTGTEAVGSKADNTRPDTN